MNKTDNPNWLDWNYLVMLQKDQQNISNILSLTP